jgi:hypothetical protein
MADDYRLQEVFDSLQKYAREDVFDSFRDQTFFRYSPEERIIVLTGWDRMMAEETKPSRATAELISKKRELDAMHELLSRAGR